MPHGVGNLQMAKKVREQGIETATRLRAAGLRPTRQRLELAGMLFAGGHRPAEAASGPNTF